MEFKMIIVQVFALFFMMAVGFLARKKHFMTDEVKRGMTEILIKIISPAIIIKSFSRAFEAEKLSNIITIAIGGVIIHIVLCLLCFCFFRKETPDRKAVLRFAMVFGNFGFMGFPVLQGIFGLDGVFYGAMFQAPFYLFSWTFGVSLYSKQRDLKGTLKSIFNIPLISVILSLIMYVSPFRLPDFILSPISSIGDMNTPFSMLIIGSIFADVNFKEAFSDIKIYFATALRIVMAPMMVLGVILLVNLTGIAEFKGIAFEIMVILEAMPCAAYCAIFANKYGGDAKLASTVVATATALSIITIPLIVMLLSVLGI